MFHSHSEVRRQFLVIAVAISWTWGCSKPAPDGVEQDLGTRPITDEKPDDVMIERQKETSDMDLPEQVEDYPEGVYVIGKTRDLLRYRNVPERHPQTMLLPYMKLRLAEEAAWKAESPLESLSIESSTTKARITELLQADPLHYSPEVTSDLVNLPAHEADQSWTELCRFYRAATPMEREFIRSQIDEDLAWNLLTFSKRAAISGFRAGSLEAIRDSLTAHAIEDLRWGDVRDNLVALGLIYHCAQANNARPNELFIEAAESTGPGMAAVLKDFIRRGDLVGILKAMGWHEVVNSDGQHGFQWGSE